MSRASSRDLPLTAVMMSPSFTLTSGARQRAALRRQFRLAAVDAVDAVAFAGARQHGAQAGGRAFGTRAAHVARTDLRMQRADFAHHHAQHVVQFGAVGHALDQRRVARAHGVPVDAAHLRVVQEVAVHAPGVVEHLLPFHARIGD